MSGINPVLANALANPPMADPKYWGQQMENMNALQDYNAKQAWGQALQQATDPTTGTVDYGKAQALAAGNPMARAGMATNLATTSNIRSQQIDQTSGLYNLVGRMSASLMKDPSDANVAAIRAQAVNAGLPPGALTEIDRIAALPVDQRATEAYNHNVGALDALGRLQYGNRGVPTTFQTGGNIQGGTYDPVTGALRPAGQPVQMTPAIPAQGTTVDIRHADGTLETVLPDQVDSVLRNKPGSSVVQPGTGGGGGAANNPLNMRFVGQPGATNSNGFAAFSTPEAGQAATDALFRSYAAGGINTLTGLISKWAPPSENDTAGYIARVAKATGLDPNAPIDLTNPAIATKIQQAMAVVEGNKNARVMPPQGPQGGQQTTAAATPPATGTAPPAAPAGPPGVQMGGTPPPPPGGSQAPYTGGGIGNALAPGGAANPVVIRGTPIPAGRVVGAIQQGMQTAAATPMPANALMAGPGAPSGGAPAPTSPAMPQSGWGSVVGSYGGGPAAPATPVVAPQPTAQPPAQAVPPQAGRGAGWSAPPWIGPVWEQSAKEYSTDVSREGGLASRIQPYQSALSIIKAHPDLKTGPTSQQWNNWGSTLQQWGIQLPSMPGDSVAAYQELAKALHQGLVQSGAYSGTDMARLEAEASNPSPGQTVDAIRELSARQIGYERFQMARLKQFRSLHPGEDLDQAANQYRTQTNQWASNLDPVAFGADNLKPQDIATYRKGLTPQQDDKFLRSIKEAHRLYPEITPEGK